MNYRCIKYYKGDGILKEKLSRGMKYVNEDMSFN